MLTQGWPSVADAGPPLRPHCGPIWNTRVVTCNDWSVLVRRIYSPGSRYLWIRLARGGIQRWGKPIPRSAGERVLVAGPLKSLNISIISARPGVGKTNTNHWSRPQGNRPHFTVIARRAPPQHIFHITSLPESMCSCARASVMGDAMPRTGQYIRLHLWLQVPVI